MPERYAIYFSLPPEEPVARLAAAWFSYDAFTGQMVKEITDARLEALKSCHPDAAQHASQYGFHATLKPPFQLVDGKTRADLITAFDKFCKKTRPFQCEQLKVQTLGKFIALMPAEHCPALYKLAKRAVKKFERFRADLTPEEYLRRHSGKLTLNQQSQLHKWGYPYVIDEFRFHMTLTDPLKKEPRISVLDGLTQILSPFLGIPLIINRLYLFHQTSADSRFKIIHSRSLYD